MHDVVMCMSQIRHNDLQTCSHTSTEERKALPSSTKLCVSHFCLTFYYAKKDKPETKRRHRHVNGRITYQELTNRLNDVEVLTCKIGNGWKSFNTRTIKSSPASRSTFLHTTWLRHKTNDYSFPHMTYRDFIYPQQEIFHTTSTHQHHR